MLCCSIQFVFNLHSCIAQGCILHVSHQFTYSGQIFLYPEINPLVSSLSHLFLSAENHLVAHGKRPGMAVTLIAKQIVNDQMKNITKGTKRKSFNINIELCFSDLHEDLD